MELCQEETVATWLQQHKTWNHHSEPRRLRVFGGIVAGLHHIHQAGFVHRDIKPSNVFLTADETPRIGDFGLCVTQSVGREATSQEPKGLGSSLYMAPELLHPAEDARPTDKIDIFALGICLFELGYRLETAMERVKVLSQLRDSGALPRDLQAAGPLCIDVLRMVSHDPKSRPSAEEIKASPLTQGRGQGAVQGEASRQELTEEVRLLRAALHDRNAMITSQAEMILQLQAQLAATQQHGPGPIA